MSSFAAQLLDELMGRDRNANSNENRRVVKWDDADVCKFFLSGFCPHDLFTNTRADLGECEKLHDNELKKSYEGSTRFEKMGYEEDFMRYLQNLLNDVERRIKRGHARLALNSMQLPYGVGPTATREEQIEILTKKISDLVKEVEELGCEGKVEEAQGVMKLCEQLEEERAELQTSVQRDKDRLHDGEDAKKMIVCEVCGALLVAGDAQQRLDEHLMGKQHMGYARIRAYIEGRKKKAVEEEEEREARLIKEREEREKEREKEREERRKRQEEREKEREREREKDRRKRRSRSRSRSKRSRSRDRDRRRRSRSRDRRRRSRSRDRHRRRSRSNSRSRHSSRDHRRSRSRDKSHKSRSSSKDHRDKKLERSSTEKEQTGKRTNAAASHHFDDIPTSENNISDRAGTEALLSGENQSTFENEVPSTTTEQTDPSRDEMEIAGDTK